MGDEQLDPGMGEESRLGYPIEDIEIGNILGHPSGMAVVAVDPGYEVVVGEGLGHDGEVLHDRRGQQRRVDNSSKGEVDGPLLSQLHLLFKGLNPLVNVKTAEEALTTSSCVFFFLSNPSPPICTIFGISGLEISMNSSDEMKIISELPAIVPTFGKSALKWPG